MRSDSRREPTAARACVAGALALALACVHAGPVGVDGQLRHASGVFAVPDLGERGWTRVSVPGADFAFRDPDGAVIAVRSRCRVRDPLSLEWRARELFVGVKVDRREQRAIEVDGVPGYEIVAHVDDLELRTVVLWANGCLVDLALARPRPAEPDPSFQAFVSGFRVIE